MTCPQPRSSGRCGREPGRFWSRSGCSIIYTGPQVGEGKKSLAYALRFQAPDRTLTDAESGRQLGIMPSQSAAERTGAVQRTVGRRRMPMSSACPTGSKAS